MSVKTFFGILLILILSVDSSHGQVAFGRNKVQYTEFKWQVLKTEHFDIYYYPEMAELARTGALYAEEAYIDMQNRFLHNVATRIPLIFYSSHFHFEQTNTIDQLIPEGVGGFFEYLKGRVVIPSDGNLYKFRHVIRHEMVHVFTHSKFNRVMKDYRKSTNKFFPLWFTEGIAEYWSGDPQDHQAQMVLRDAVLSGYLVPISEMYRINGTYLMYKQGEDITRYIGETFGDFALLQLFENIWKTANFEENFKITLGKDYKQFEKEWMYSLKKKYFPLMEKEDIPSYVSEVVTTKGFNFKPHTIINEETKIPEVYYIANMTGYTSIFKTVLKKDDTENYPNPKLVIQGEKSQEYESFKAFDSGLSINKDQQLLFITKSGEHDVLHLYDLKNDEAITTYSFKEIVKIGNAGWANNNRQVVFSALDKAGNTDIYIFDTNSEELTRLTQDMFDDKNPIWSPDDQYIIFSSDRIEKGFLGRHGMFSIHISTGELTGLSHPQNGSDLVSSFSDSGKELLFTSHRSGSQNIWYSNWTDIQQTISSKGVQPLMAHQLTSLATAAFDPTISGNLMVFSAFEGFSFKVRLLEQADELIQQPIHSEIINEQPWILAHQWQPNLLDGESIQSNTSYDREYSLDIAQGAISSEPLLGTVGGVALALSDMLGDDRWFFTLYNTAETQSEFFNSFNFAVSRVIRGSRTNYGYGVYHFSGRRYDFTDPDVYFNERLIGGFMAISYPLSSFNRLESYVSLAYSKKEALGYLGLYGGDIMLNNGQARRDAVLVSNAISYIYDNSLWAFTGPLDGKRFSLTLGYTTDVSYNNVNYYTIIADYRHYFRMTDRSLYAFRALTRYNDGDEARRFYMIGSWDIRGYRNFELRGRKLWMMNHEIRFPLLDNFGLKFPFFDINFSQFRGALFLDAGNAWDTDYPGTLGSYGIGIRYNLAGAIVLRYDIGRKWTHSLGNIGASPFYQFFFGWDF